MIGIGATFGGLLGNGIPGIFAAGLDVSDSEADLLVLKKTIYTQNGLITLVSLLFLILFKAKPKTPPSKTAYEAEHTAAKTKVKGEKRGLCKVLCCNLSFVCNCIIFAI